MDNRSLICINCPIGCNLKVEIDKDIKIYNNRCKRGEIYAKNEIISPKRILTTSVKLVGEDRWISVKSKEPIPKEDIFKAMSILKNIEVKSPIHIGDIIKKNILNTGVDIVATKDI